MTWPTVSIVTPSYNQAQFLEETIISVLQQDYPSIEYIIIDGASTDGSVDIVRQYEDRLAYWVSEPDRGQCHAINKGFARAQGAIIAWLNSDDVYRPGAIRQVVEAFRDHPGSVAVVGACALVDAGRNVFSCKQPTGFAPERLLRGGGVPGQPAVFLRRQVLEKIGGLREDLHYVLDWEYWLRVGMHYSSDQVVLLDSVLAEARIWLGNKTSIGLGETATSDSQLNAIERRKVLDDLYAAPELPTELRRLKHVAYSFTYWGQAKQEFRMGQSGAARRDLIKAYQVAPDVHSLIDLFLFVAGTYLGYPMCKRLRCVYRAVTSIRRKSSPQNIF